MKTVWLVIVVGLLCSSEFIETQSATAQDQTSIDPTIEKTRKTEAYIAPY